MNRFVFSTALIALVTTTGLGCGKSKNPVAPYNPVIDPANFVQTVDNPFFPLTPGTIFSYEGETTEGTETNKMYVTHDTKEILGVTCVVVADTVWLDGSLIEATIDWYAQDKEGDVWYFGEDVKDFENGVFVGTEGSWLAGVDGAKPGIIMEGDPKIGDKYRQEYYIDEAEDWAEVLSLSESATVPYGSFQNCLKTREWTPLEPDLESNKYYAPGVGFVKEVYTKGALETSELVGITTQ